VTVSIDGALLAHDLIIAAPEAARTRPVGRL